MTTGKPLFSPDGGWAQKVIDADAVWRQVKTALQNAGRTLPETPRRPDVRMIVNNISGHAQTFHNPGDHSGQKPENIPAEGEKTAAMIMVKGGDLETQYKNAAALDRLFSLGTRGLSDEFVAALKSGACGDLVAEAYGPAPYAGQAGKLVDVEWRQRGGQSTLIAPVRSLATAFGARAAIAEKVFLVQFPIFVRGSGTVPELVESAGMCVAVSEDYKTKAETTRPIVPSVAREFYGAFFDALPTVVLGVDGTVQRMLIGGEAIDIPPPAGAHESRTAPSPQ